MKTLLKITCTLAINLLFFGNAFAFDIVSDPTHMAQTAAGWAAQAADMKKEYGQMVEQFQELQQQTQQLQQQYQSITGSRGLGSIMNNPELRNYLPDDWKQVYDNVKSGGYSGLTGTAQSIFNQNKIFDGCANLIGDERTACEARAVKPSQDKGLALDAYEAAQSRMTQIDDLMGQINQTQDPKAIAELQARIAAEQANIQNEHTKLQLYSMVAAAEEKVQEQRQHEINAKALARRGWLQPKAITINN